jgi:hypothetical protein
MNNCFGALLWLFAPVKDPDRKALEVARSKPGSGTKHWTVRLQHNDRTLWQAAAEWGTPALGAGTKHHQINGKADMRVKNGRLHIQHVNGRPGRPDDRMRLSNDVATRRPDTCLAASGCIERYGRANRREAVYGVPASACPVPDMVPWRHFFLEHASPEPGCRR